MLSFLKEIKRKLMDCFHKHKIIFIFLMIAFFTGVLIGLISIINFRKIITIKNLTDSCLYTYIKDNSGLFIFFFKRFFRVIVILIAVIIISCNKYTYFINGLILLYLGYILIFNIGVIIICFGFFGLIYASISMLLLGLLYCFIILLTMLIGLDCNRCYNGYIYGIKTNIILFLTIIVSILIISIVEMLILPFLTSTFLINYF